MIWNWKLNILAIATLVAIALIFYYIYVPVKAGDPASVEINIEEGDGLDQIAEEISNAGLIRSRLLFILYVKAAGEENNLKAGRYIFSKSLNIPAIVSLLVSGRSEPDDIKITIPEGFNVWEIDDRLVELGLISEGQFSSRYYSDEGYLFPDTYRLRQPSAIRHQLSAEELIQELRRKMTENFRVKISEIFKNLSVERQKEVIIVASMLEKETKTEEDMHLVAGIIYKRLELGIPLQIDATVIYGACLRDFRLSTIDYSLAKNCDVTFQSPAAEIKIDGLFNTYIRKGLPPGAISSPGLKAIGAALNPQQSDYLYYLSTRDGQMIYSKTSTEHAANRKKYLGI